MFKKPAFLLGLLLLLAVTIGGCHATTTGVAVGYYDGYPYYPYYYSPYYSPYYPYYYDPFYSSFYFGFSYYSPYYYPYHYPYYYPYYPYNRRGYRGSPYFVPTPYGGIRSGPSGGSSGGGSMPAPAPGVRHR
ncbi:MAG TPA: hypothetical protein VFG95_03860 [Nitrospiria bacterium]|nr:hypothetical protein [Nitrospiria bacterium]